MSRKALIVDDDSGDRDLIRSLLKDMDFQDIVLAENGEDGIEECQNQMFDLVIVDTVMPGMDGLETCRQIRELAGQSLKIIIHTGKINAIDPEAARAAGADGYAFKTPDLKSLKSAICEALEEKG